MNKNLVLLVLIAVVMAFTVRYGENFLLAPNVANLLMWTGLFGILSVGVALVIITGGIDLSIGSVVGLVACLTAWLMVRKQVSPAVTFAIVGLVSLSLGLIHGLLITKLKLQPFVVTLCSLLICRGVTRWFTSDQEQGLGKGYEALRWLGTGRVAVFGDYALPVPFLVLLVVAVLAAVFLNGTIYGRYLLALGRNEQATRFSGINTDRMTIVAYVICSLLAGLGGVLFLMQLQSAQPSAFGAEYELYAIAGAVVGGCSLRGGEGSILGVVLGAFLLRLLQNSITLLNWPSQIELAIIGLVILAGAITDEVVRRVSARRQIRRTAA